MPCALHSKNRAGQPWACPGHPRVYGHRRKKDVDGRDKPGHDAHVMRPVMYYTPAPRDPKATPVRINLLSDTQTPTTQAMREAMARADVGDEQSGDEPTVNLLWERVDEL